MRPIKSGDETTYIYRNVPQIRPPPPTFAILALVQNARGGCDIFSRDYALPSGAIKHDLIVGAEREAERCSRRKW